MKMKSLFVILAYLTSHIALANANNYTAPYAMQFAPNCCNEAPCHPNTYNPPAYFRCNQGCNFLDTLCARIDFLWWRASEDNLELGVEDQLILGSTTFNSSREKRPNFKFDPGYRLGLSTTCPDGCWDAAVNWTHFNTSAHTQGLSTFRGGSNLSTNLIEITEFNSYWELNPLENPIYSSKGSWKLDLDLVDLELAHRFYINKCLVLRPHVGLRIGRIAQGYRIQSLNFIEIGGREPSFEQFTSELHARNDFLGVGPRLGLDVKLDMCREVSLFGQFAGSLLFGSFDKHTKENSVTTFESGFIINDVSTGLGNYNLSNSNNRCSRFVTDIAIGLSWEHCVEWCQHFYPVSLTAAWEFHAFYNFNNFLQNNNAKIQSSFVPPLPPINQLQGTPIRTLRGNLYTQGLTLSFNVGF
jgi:hypothetical protein